ncbi:hypothetical protein AB0C76_24640 [Kitasatospora sp. NPDC048722]|uniref:hypothetical protein n=1 Tax=Kitasatospora sp. NPDC048722 TaxID=3155639 RepID=UPI0033CB1EF7
MASPGYGKKTAPGELPHSPTDFAHLPPREAYLASLIDRLPDGASMDVKTLAAHQPHYGQMAVRTALNSLSAAGHLRRFRERVGDDRTRWVLRTHFSRTSRSDAWWAEFIATGESGTGESADDPPAASTKSATVPPKERPRSPAYVALADLGLADPRLALSAADCEALEPLAAEWLARGTPPALFTAVLTAGLPPDGVHSPAAFTRRRLLHKMPPERTAPAVAPATRILECTACRTPCRPQVLLGGLCRACRSGTRHAAPPPPDRLSPAAVRAHADRIRALTKATRS